MNAKEFLIKELEAELAEEREKSAQVQLQSILECEGRLKAEAELARVRKAYKEHNKVWDCYCSYCCALRPDSKPAMKK